ncbi:MAG TPA: hypothetical protein VFS43_11520 [Polyangiaceae bacterium]|nr:hypothetical protein [Polyangiaceae bacterium]
MTSPLDPTLYLRPARLDVAGARSLRAPLRAARPAALPPPAERAAARLAAALDALDAASRQGGGLARGEADVRRFDRQLDNLWAAVQDRLLTFTLLADGDPQRALAEALVAALFPDGLAFLHLPYLEQHAESERRLARCVAEGLDPSLRALVGSTFVDALVEAHAAYGRALGVGAPPAEGGRELRVIEALRGVQAALRSYVLQLLAFADDEPAAVEAVRSALLPLDALRGAPAGAPAPRPEGETSRSPGDAAPGGEGELSGGGGGRRLLAGARPAGRGATPKPRPSARGRGPLRGGRQSRGPGWGGGRPGEELGVDLRWVMLVRSGGRSGWG